MWVQIALFVALTIISYLLRPKPPKPKAGELQAPTVNPDKPIPVVFGTVTITVPNVAWYGDLRTVTFTLDGGKK